MARCNQASRLKPIEEVGEAGRMTDCWEERQQQYDAWRAEEWAKTKRQSEMVRRFHALMRKGYEPDLDRPFEDRVHFGHARAPSLVLGIDGSLTSSAPLLPETADEHVIPNRNEHDAEAFDRFVETVRDPLHKWRTGRQRRHIRFEAYSNGFLIGIGLAIILAVRSCGS